MESKLSLHWTLTFFVGITLVNCRDMTFFNNLDSNWFQNTLTFNQKFPKSQGHNKIIQYNRTSKQTNDNVSTISSDTEYEFLSPYEFSPWLSSILTPEIFSQSNPLNYLLDKIILSSKAVIESLSTDVSFFLSRNKFPSYYVPYAKMLSSLLNCAPDLTNVQRAVFNIVNSDVSRPRPFALPKELATPELSAVFSSDVFSDPKPPSIIFNKTMNLSRDIISNLIIELQEIYWYNRLPGKYVSYAKALLSLMQNRDCLKV